MKLFMAWRKILTGEQHSIKPILKGRTFFSRQLATLIKGKPSLEDLLRLFKLLFYTKPWICKLNCLLTFAYLVQSNVAYYSQSRKTSFHASKVSQLSSAQLCFVADFMLNAELRESSKTSFEFDSENSLF